MKHITRDRRLTPEEVAEYKIIREQIAQELPDLIARHHEKMAEREKMIFTEIDKKWAVIIAAEIAQRKWTEEDTQKYGEHGKELVDKLYQEVMKDKK